MNARGSATGRSGPALPREFGFFAPVGRLGVEPNGAELRSRPLVCKE